jgi:hypothetical protein
MAEKAVSWFFENLFKNLFSHADVLALVGEPLSHDTLQNWANREYITPKIIRGKRKYTTLEVASICLAQPLVHDFEVNPLTAINTALNAILIFSRSVRAKKTSFEALEYQMGAYTGLLRDPLLFDRRTAIPSELNGALVLLPVGHLLMTLAQKQLELVNSRSKGRS